MRSLIVFLSGILGGLYGSTVGGGALATLPVLLLLGLPTSVALGTQRLGAVFLEFSSAARFYHARRFNVRLAVSLGIASALGSIIGVSVVVQIPDKTLSLIVATMLLIVAAILFNKERLGIRERPLKRKHLLYLIPSTVLLGFYGGFLGAGFGAFAGITLLVFGFSLTEGAAIGRFMGLCSAVAASIVFAQKGVIDYPLALALGAGFSIGSWVGVGISLKKGDAYIKNLLLIVIGISLLKELLEFLDFRIM